VEGQNASIAFRWAEGHYDRLPALAAELVALRVAVLFTAGGPPAGFAAKAAAQTIPVVFSAALDPDRIGLVASLNRPGGNVTGMSIFPSQLAAKSVQLLKELRPAATLIGYLVNPSNPAAHLYAEEASNAAKALGIAVHISMPAPSPTWTKPLHLWQKRTPAGSSYPLSRSLTASATGSWRWLRAMPFLRSTVCANTPWLAD